jgi:mannosyltransferase
MGKRWWPLAALLAFAAALRIGTLNLQSFWYDEAYTPVHVLHANLWATLESVVHRENAPPLWYLLTWGFSRLFGTGEVALRLPSALAGTATVAVAWGIGRELGGRRAAVATAALVAVNPLLVWYSQEARAYGLLVFFAALAMLCCLRADRSPTPRRLAAFAASGAAALATHYFAVFLVVPMSLWLLWRQHRRRRGTEEGSADTERGRAMRGRAPVWAVAAIGAVGAALVPLALAQGGHGTQWIGEWPLAERLEAIPQYYLAGYTGAALGHGIELAVALLILAAVGHGLWRVLTPGESNGALLAGGLAACGVLIPVVLALGGADYLAPRNVVAAMVPLTAAVAVIGAARRTGGTGAVLVGLTAAAFLVLAVDVDLSPRLQRGDWRGLARAIGAAAPSAPGRSGIERPARVVTTVELGAAALEYYLPPLHNLPRGTSVEVSEIDETGYPPLRPGAGKPPAPGFRPAGYRNVHGLILYRFRSPVPRTVSEAALREHVIAEGRAEVLVSAARPSRGPAAAAVP